MLDMLARLKSLLPARWFAPAAPNYTAVTGALADALQFIAGLIDYARSQIRIMTATGICLDLVAYDFFGNRLQRSTGQLDAAFRARIRAEILRQRVTRAGMIAALTGLTGHAPAIFEPSQPMDAGSYGGPLCGYGVAGGWGSLDFPAQAFLTVYRPSLQGVPGVAGYGASIGGYGAGSIAWTNPGNIAGQVTDQDIYDLITRTKPTGSLMWVRLQ
jgi:hypothetical protein